MNKENNEKTRVAIYHMALDPIRKGCIDVQIDILKYYAQEHNWEIINVYYDNTNIEKEKDALGNLLEDASLNMFDLVLMKNAYYISRHTNKYIQVKKTLDHYNVKLHTLVEGDL